MKIAADICVYTNDMLVIETLDTDSGPKLIADKLR
jgi:hypothetical protein